MSTIKSREVIITKETNSENKKNTSKKVKSPKENDINFNYEKTEQNPKIDSYTINRKNEEREITKEMVNQMKIYFNNFFLASPAIINEIFSVKNNTIQHPIYAFRGECFICNKSSVAHLKDERGDIFLGKKKIKLIKNSNILELLDDSSYMIDKNYYNDQEEDDIELSEDNRYEENFSERYRNNKYNINAEQYGYPSLYSDSNFEYEKGNYRDEEIDIDEIKENIKKDIEFLDEIKNNHKNLNRNNNNNVISNLNSPSNNTSRNHSIKRFGFSPKANDQINTQNNQNIIIESVKERNSNRIQGNKNDSKTPKQREYGNLIFIYKDFITYFILIYI